MKRLSLAFRCFFSLLFKGTVSESLLAELRTRVAAPSKAEPAAEREQADAAAAPSAVRPPALPEGAERAVQMLALLQRESRLVDFLQEDIGPYDDAQVGAAVRDLHAACSAALARYVTLEPVLPGEEGHPITVEPGFDAGAVKLIGNVTGTLPASGVMRHHGWRARGVRLPDVPGGAARSVIAPAEVELS